MYDIKDKVALITGGATGIGLSVAKELLQNGVKGLTIADTNENSGKIAASTLEEQFGKGKVIFVKMDVRHKEEYNVAFKQTLQHFQHIDILFNNAGIVNDKMWEKEIDINLKGVINGIILGMENYLKQHKRGAEAVIINTSSVAALQSVAWVPIYTATKSAIASLTTSWGCDTHYERTKVKVVGVCPGATDTSIFGDGDFALFPEYSPSEVEKMEKYRATFKQSPNFVAKEVIRIMKFAPNGSLWVVEGKSQHTSTNIQTEKFLKIM